MLNVSLLEWSAKTSCGVSALRDFAGSDSESMMMRIGEGFVSLVTLTQCWLS